MLVVRVAEETVEDAAGQYENNFTSQTSLVFSSDECEGAADTQRAFVACGTVIEYIKGVARLIRLEDLDLHDEPGKEDTGQNDRVTWGGRRNSREWRERRESSASMPEATPTPTVFLPAVPSYLPLWGLLSPEDAVRQGDSLPIESSHTKPLKDSPPSPTDISETTVTKLNLHNGDDDSSASPAAAESASLPLEDTLRGLHISGIEKGTEAYGADDRDQHSAASKKDTVSKGAVRLLQVISAEHTAYRYAVILHFWETADAAHFVEEFNGLSLPARGVLKPLFLADVSGLPTAAGSGLPTTGSVADAHDDDRAHRRRRRSLSEGVCLAKAAVSGDRGRTSTAAGGTEEAKSNWPGPSSYSGLLLTSSPPRNPRSRRANDEHKGEDSMSPPPPQFPRQRSFGAITGTDPGAGLGVCFRTSSGNNLGKMTADELKGIDPGSDLRIGSSKGPNSGVRGNSSSGARERKGGDAGDLSGDYASSGSLSPPLLPWQSPTVMLTLKGPSTGPENRRARPWTEEPVWTDGAGVLGGKTGVRARGKAEGVYAGNGGNEERGTELPPCPVCLDRLDPLASGVPSARRSDRCKGRGLDDETRGRCRHLACGANVAEKETKKENGLKHARKHSDENAGVRGVDAVEADGNNRSSEASVAAIDHSTGRALNSRGGGSSASSVTGLDGSFADSADREKGGGVCEGKCGGVVLNLTMWKGSTCRVCRCFNVALEGAPQKQLYCETCRIAHNLWICMVCGHIGCGRYTEEHAKRHFCLFRHSYSLELSTGRVWDYAGDCYAHRALRGHLAPHDTGHHPHGEGRQERSRAGSPWAGGVASGAGLGRDTHPPLYSEGGFDVHGEAGQSREGFSDSLKVAVVSREYEALVARQLQEQQRYFEGLIAKAISANAEANAPAGEVLSEAERGEVQRLRQEVEGFSRRYEEILENLRVDEEAARRVRAENRRLVMQQKAQKEAVGRSVKDTLETKRLCEGQIAELEGQMQDLMFFLKAQQEVKASPQREDIVGGLVVVGAGSGTVGVSSDGDGRSGGKETEREKLAKRIKELSDARRAGGGVN